MPSCSNPGRACAASGRSCRTRLKLVCRLALLAVCALSVSAQQPGQLSDTAVTLQGVVTNAATGEPLARALVHIEGNAGAGALSDNNGRYEIPGVPLGPQLIEVRKPGFRDGPAASGPLVVDETVGPAHTVWVAAQMQDVNFALTPTGAIHGQISLSSGDAAEGIVVQLARRTVQDGRAIWQSAGAAKTNSDGAYRFAGLADGSYVLYTHPAMDSDEAATLVAKGSGGAVERSGYAGVFYSDAREPSGASRITLRPGDQVEADLTLTLEPFHPVIATVVLPPALKTGTAGANFTAAVLDSAGRQLPYAAQYDGETQTVQALLPDGSYTLVLTALPRPASSNAPVGDASAQPFVGVADVSVAGHAVSSLRMAVTAQPITPVQLNLTGNGGASGQNGQTAVLLSPATGWVDDSMNIAYATGSSSGPMKTISAQPGAYWVHTHAQRGFCEGSITAGGTNLAREPLSIGISSVNANMELTLRDDCARLTLHLPQSLSLPSIGDERFYTVYVIPDFDSTTDPQPITLRPSTGGTITLSDLAPGNYHVYTFAELVLLAYRNPEAMAALPVAGQALTLAPGAAGDLVVEAPQP